MLYLHSMGHFHPENIISNTFLENLDIDTTNEWIMERVGIQNRRTVLCGAPPSWGTRAFD